jgi:aminoglycoside phosphotransferase (APT) family kinase protein
LGLPTIKESNHEFAATLLQASSKFENVIERLRCFVDSGSVSDVTQLVHGDFRLGNVILDLKEAKVVAVLDWEISTLGHPLLDLAYLMMPWYIPGGFLRNFKKIKEGQILPKGLLNEMDYVALYCQRRNIPMVEKEEWTFWKALTCFRLAAINHGVYARGVGGNAGSNKAVLSGPSCLVLINSAEGMLNELENSMGVGGNKLGAKL